MPRAHGLNDLPQDEP
jgi:membrane associated rhomboid family serine protease